MCGICGRLEFNGSIVDKTLINKMCNTIIHRGPDDDGIYTAPYIGLGQRRLSVIDLRKAASPPLSNEDGTIWIVFNGEIYNFQALRETLTEKGHVFSTATDTEVIVHLYEEYGIQCLQYMRGMFAFALWDVNKKRLFAARDRLGKKPFFYTKNASSLIFGSEIKAVTANADVSISPNFSAIDSYLTCQYVPSPLTAFSNIYKLKPAHYMLCGVDRTLITEKYWTPPLIMEKSTATRDELESEILNQLKEAVRLRLISDVPIGVFLSGGIDSGTVVAMMATESTKRIKTFSIGFEEDNFNELPYARLVAERYETDHHEFIVKQEAADILPILVKHYNEPFADSSALPAYYVSKMAKNYVTVALSGDGGDESFGGYSHYEQVLRWENFDVFPWPFRKAFYGIIRNLVEQFPHTNFMDRASRALTMLGSQLPERYLLQMSIVKPQEKRACYTERFNSLLRKDKIDNLHLDWDEAINSLDWIMQHDQSFYLPDCLMVKIDRASMSNSLEVRTPFLDHKFVEFAATIPSAMKRDATGGKLILKSAVKHLLPVEILNKSKTGFGVPLAKWFRGELSGLLKSTLLDETSKKRGLFQQAFLKKMITEQIEGRRDWSSRLWAFLFLELWFREFID